MSSKPPLKKLLIVSIYTSPVIGTLLITPIFILSSYVHGLYSQVVLQITGLIFLLWLLNIAVTGLANKWQLKRAYGLLFSYCLCFVFVPLFQMAVLPLIKGVGPQQTFHFYLIIFSSINTVILVITDLVLTREKNAAIALENTQLKMNNLEAVNERLKQQIHPHFLFNSLSTLKTLIGNSPENAQEYLIKLSDFLRYGLSSNMLNTAQVSKELSSCLDYLEMQKIRFGEALQFEVNIPEPIKAGYWMPIFSLQVLAENAIKHNALTIQAPLHINIIYKEPYITVSNNVQQKTVTEASAGTGLANLNERYKILSGDGIDVSKTDDTFFVSLKVFDNENCNYRR